ncbi:MAG: transglycosylase SLT domain-containing protein [Acidobacteriia bacterium]|nr:transglycosylase SLT domain-containing protein [Terriglobia bacterium]
MIRTRSVLAGILALALLTAGCEDAAKRPVRAGGVPPPPGSPAPAAPSGRAAAPVKLAPLPLGRMNRAALPLVPQAPSEQDALIARVEAKFAAGEQEYRAGHLTSARRKFDQALDELLESGLDLEGDPRFAQLYHRLVDRAYAYELQAFQEGGGLQEAPTVAAAIDEVEELDAPADPALKGRAEEAAQKVSHDLPLTVNDTVLSFLNFFQTAKGRAIVETGLRRAGRYREMISRILREEGMPQDLIYLAQAESAFQPQALSRAGARGMWQFVPYRGQQYGLRRTWWVDERQDPERATRAAARHLRDLYSEFGDWYLAIAAYNCGPGNVQKGIERTGYADFWELFKRNVLPRETRNYVPIILALTLIAKDAERYGISVEPESPAPFDVVKPGRPLDLHLVAETLDVDLDTLRMLNPALLRMVTPADPDFELRLPKNTAQRFFSEIAAIPPEKWVSWRRHRVEPGDTLTSIARRYHVTATNLAEANSLGRSEALHPGQKLVIPAAQAEPLRSKLVRYRVRRGDTLSGISDRFGVTSEEVKRWNRLRSNRVGRGMVLRIYSPGGGPEIAPARRPARRGQGRGVAKPAGQKKKTSATKP